jgi:hypothetical protein
VLAQRRQLCGVVAVGVGQGQAGALLEQEFHGLLVTQPRGFHQRAASHAVQLVEPHQRFLLQEQADHFGAATGGGRGQRRVNGVR